MMLKKHELMGWIKPRCLFICCIILSTLTSVFLYLYSTNHNRWQYSYSDIPMEENRNTQSDTSGFKIEYNEKCSFNIWSIPKANLNTAELQKNLSFSSSYLDIFWNRGFNYEVDYNRWSSENKLKVLVVLHTHNAPGWVSTIENYYYLFSGPILNGMLQELSQDVSRKFIWSEMCFFDIWWNSLSEYDKVEVKSAIRNKQLEFVTGGWVQNDEAGSHWISILQQMTQGHQWLKKHFDYTPVSHWALDPYGYSPTQGFLLKKMGLKNMLIHKVHYILKTNLVESRNTEFRWRQFWDQTGETEMFTHMTPFVSYDIAHSCGPNPSVCRKFDFSRLPILKESQKWFMGWPGRSPEAINDNNIERLSYELLQQFQKKSMLYKTNVLLVPLGDEFTYLSSDSFGSQYGNYEHIFDFMNSDVNMNIDIKFGTLTDYFDALHAENAIKTFPTLIGDFFTYSDKHSRYWSGYYTSRPYYKKLGQELLNYLRAAEIILSLTNLSENNMLINEYKKRVLSNLVFHARTSLSLFQHYDAIAGTSAKHVVRDYGEKLYNGIQAACRVITGCTTLLLMPAGSDVAVAVAQHFDIDEMRYSFNSLPQRYIIDMSLINKKEIVIYNTLPYSRREVVRFVVSTPYIQITHNNEAVYCQVLPLFKNKAEISNKAFMIAFVTDLRALGLKVYTIKHLDDNRDMQHTVFSKVYVLNDKLTNKPNNHFKITQVSPNLKKFDIRNDHTVLHFNKIGLLNGVEMDGYIHPVTLDFARYASYQSDAYAFSPRHEAVPIEINDLPPVRIVKGPIVSLVLVKLPYVEHTVTLFNTTGADNIGFEIENLINISEKDDLEFIMRITTDIETKNELYTDLNGYQLIRRKWYRKLTIQGNYYPMSTMAYIEDENTRLTVVTDTPLGCASLKEGQIEIMLDRRVHQNNYFRVGQAILDNEATKETFRIILEKRLPKCKSVANDYPAGFPSLSGYVASQSLLFPLIRILKNDYDKLEVASEYSPAQAEFGIDYGLASFRPNVTIDGKYGTGIVINRQYLDGCFSGLNLVKRFPLSTGSVNLKHLLSHTKRHVMMRKMTLSYLHVQEVIDFNSPIELCPMDIQAYVLIN